MKIFLAAFIFSSGMAFATCPDLKSVTTACKSLNGKIPGNDNQVITQEIVDGVMNYNFTYKTYQSDDPVTNIMIADGKARREMEVDPNSGITFLKATTVTCSDKALLSHATMFIDGQFLGIMDTETTKVGNKITTVYEGTLFGRDVEDTVICE